MVVRFLEPFGRMSEEVKSQKITNFLLFLIVVNLWTENVSLVIKLSCLLFLFAED